MIIKNIILLNIFILSTTILNSMEDPRESNGIYKRNKRTYDSTLIGQ